jgi:GTPase
MKPTREGKALPVVSLVGRPNVGKSTLFNRLTRTRDALVADVPGLTRDRHYGQGRVGSSRFIVIDTGGFEPVAKSGITAQMAKQTRQAVLESDFVVFVVDGRDGLTPHDQTIADELRRSRAKITLVVNKTEGMRREVVTAEFHALGLGDPIAISSAHGDGVNELVAFLVPPSDDDDAEANRSRKRGRGRSDEQSPLDTSAALPEAPPVPVNHRIKLAIIGRPNVGKSTLCNTLLGEERMIAFDEPGTTRDSVSVEFDKDGKRYTLIDTAGIRRRGKVSETIEKFSVVKTLQSIEDCNVAILLLDAHESVADQDAHIAGYILEAGKALVVGVNKWDGLNEADKARIKTEITRKLAFMKFASVHFISAIKPFGISALMRSVDQAHAAAFRKLPTPKLTRALMAAVERQTPPRRGLVRPKMRYAHQGGHNPPIIIIHGSALTDIPDAYRRYLESYFREEFSLQGTPLRIEWRSGSNPFASSETR